MQNSMNVFQLKKMNWCIHSFLRVFQEMHWDVSVLGFIGSEKLILE